MRGQKFIALAGLVVLQLFTCYYTLTAQIPCKIQHYSTEDGLSHDIVTCIYKDREGFMWFGTWDGINRFDGHRFTSFRSVAGDSSQLKNDRIDQIKEDNLGHLWIKSYDGEIYRFDKRTEKYTSLRSLISLPKEVSFGKVLATPDNQLWVGTLNKGVIVLPDLKKSPARYLYLHTRAIKALRLPSDSISFFYNDEKDGSKWIGTSSGLVNAKVGSNGGISVRTIRLPAQSSHNLIAVNRRNDSLFIATSDGQILIYQVKSVAVTKVINTGFFNLKALKASGLSSLVYATNNTGELLVLDPGKGTWTKHSSGEQGGLRSIFEDSRGDLWIEPAKRGIILFSADKHTFKKFAQRNDAYSKIPINHFNVFEDHQHRVWSVLRDGGFGYYDHQLGNFQYFYNEPGAKDRRMSNLVATTYYDKAGVMWLHTDLRGVEKIIFAPNNFRQELLNENGLFKSDNEVRGLLADHRGRIWVGAKSSRIYLIENGKKLPLPFVNMPAAGTGSAYRFYEDSKQNIWIGTKEDGMYLARPLGPDARKYSLTQYLRTNDKQSISSNQIYSILEDSYGRIWAGSFDKGLSIGKWQNGKLLFQRYGVSEGYPEDFVKIRHMVIDNKNRVWLATTNGLIIAEEKQDGKFNFHAYTKRPGDAGSLGNNDVQYILRDYRNQMWLATSGGGLNLAREAKPFNLKFEAYTKANGLANDYILSCQEDRNHNIWIATKSSIARLDVATKTCRNYNSFDGVPSLGFSEGTSQQLPDGRLVFGTIQGLIYFNPSLVREQAISANLVLTDLQVNNKTVTIGDKTGILKSALNAANHITLHHNQNILSFDYTVLDHRFDSRASYLYKLAGFDADWQQNLEQRRATYTNLPPGNYTFEVKSPDAGLYSNTPSKKISITILPPWWKTWWAYLIYILVAAGLIELARRTVMTMLRLRHNVAIEKRMADLKLTFFTNVSHELRTPLTLISNPVEQVLRSEQLSEDSRHYLTVVKRNVNRMERYVNQLLDLRKLQSGKAKINLCRVELIDFIQNIGDCFSGISTGRNIRFELHSSQNTLDALIDPDKLETVLYNIIGNAFKFSRKNSAVTVDVEMGKQAETFRISVSDQGCGVPEYDLPHIFELYHESNHDEVRNVKGTGIGLALAKELVELHGGSINAVNCSEGGLKVSIELPVGNNNENARKLNGLPAHEKILVDLPIPSKSNNDIIPDNLTQNGKPLLLLVEDNDDMRDFLCRQLSAHYQVSTAENGEDGLIIAQKLQPDIILSDVMMPKMDGIEMLGKLKHDQRTSHIPVVLLSAKSAIESQIAGLEYGADRYITKPFNNDLLLASIKSLLAQRKRYAEGLAEGNKVIDLSPSEIMVTSKDEIFLKKVIEVVEERMAEPEFNIDTVAELLNMARPTFYKKFKSLTQKAPVEFVRDIRLQRAKQYLDQGTGNIKEISYAVGFSSSRYFSTCFKAKYNLSPSDYLRELNSEHNA